MAAETLSAIQNAPNSVKRFGRESIKKKGYHLKRISLIIHFYIFQSQNQARQKD